MLHLLWGRLHFGCDWRGTGKFRGGAVRAPPSYFSSWMNMHARGDWCLYIGAYGHTFRLHALLPYTVVRELQQT
jgi:hypothetical protein